MGMFTSASLVDRRTALRYDRIMELDPSVALGVANIV